jgi:hypothetical protein
MRIILLLFSLLTMASPGQAQRADTMITGMENAQWILGGQSFPLVWRRESLLALAGGPRLELDVNFLVDKAQFEQMQGNRRLPLVFKWFRFSGARLFIANVNKDPEAVTVAEQGGQWVYHCHVVNDKITRGTWVVKPVYGNNEPVIINGQECEFRITVQ